MAKGGWDCMRHYEILANGCIPYFIDLDQCDVRTMAFLPKELIKEAMNLPGVSYLSINHKKFNKVKYYEILNKLLEHTRQYLTIKIWPTIFSNRLTILEVEKFYFFPMMSARLYEMLRSCRMKQLMGDRIVDFPKIDHIYKS